MVQDSSPPPNADSAEPPPPWILEPKLEVVVASESATADSDEIEVPEHPFDWIEGPIPSPDAKEVELTFDPQEILGLGAEEVVKLSEKIRQHIEVEILPSAATLDRETAAELLEAIKREVSPEPGTSAESYFQNLLSTLELRAGLRGDGSPFPTRQGRAMFLANIFHWGGFPRREEARYGLQVWGQILRALGCRMTPEEERATCIAIRGVYLQCAVTGWTVGKYIKAALENDGEPELVRNYREILFQRLRYREYDEVLWPEFQRAFTENLSPENLEHVKRFFAALGLWTDD